MQCFYDNILYTPFIFIEDPVDINGQRGLAGDATSPRLSQNLNGSFTPNGGHSGASTPSKGGKVDPYYLISNVSSLQC